jgi:succinylglutamate desuccinylase
MDRIIGEYGDISKGKLLIVLAGIHGNELAGIKALESIFEFLNTNNIVFKGKLVGFYGNIKALETESRFLHKDLNRQWYASKIKKLHLLPYGMLNTQEDREQKELFTAVENILDSASSRSNIFMMDLHTTSAKGGCFSITNNLPESLAQARKIPVPTINGMTNILKGTTIEYFESLGIPAVAFEAGQHEEDASITRMKASIMLMLANLGIIDPANLKLFQDDLNELEEFNKELPSAVEVVYHHAIEEDDIFVMKPGYTNFQPIIEGEELANDKNGSIYAKINGMILMPLYQKKGSDGFFVVKEINPLPLKSFLFCCLPI